jgi:hypothetical protein
MAERVFYIITDGTYRKWQGVFHEVFAKEMNMFDSSMRVLYFPEEFAAAPGILSSPEKARNAIILIEDYLNFPALQHFARQEVRPLVYAATDSLVTFWGDIGSLGLRGVVNPLHKAYDTSSVAEFAIETAKKVQKQILADEAKENHKQLVDAQFAPNIRAQYRANERVVTATGQAVVTESQLGDHPEFTTKIWLKSAANDAVAEEFKRAVEAYFGTKLGAHHEFNLSTDRRAFSANFPATEWRAVDKALRDLNQEIYQPPGGKGGSAGRRGFGL